MSRINLPVPFPDENCYSILCRYAVHSVWQSAHQVCRELFGHTVPLAGFLYKPFRTTEITRWNAGSANTVRYGADHSSLQYFSAFMEHEDSILMQRCVTGSVMTSGQEKRISGKCGFSRIRKKRFWYCPECVKEDIRRTGDTCWRRLPQIPGVSYCTRHQVRLVESGLAISEINYQMFPAAHVIDSVPDFDSDTSGNVFEEEFLQLAKDIEWLLQKGYEVGGLELLKLGYQGDTGRRIQEWRLPPAGTEGKKRFEHYLAGRIMKECGNGRIDGRTQRFLSMIISIENEYGNMERFCAERSETSLLEE